MVSGIAAVIPNGASDSGLSSDENASIKKNLRGLNRWENRLTRQVLPQRLPPKQWNLCGRE